MAAQQSKARARRSRAFVLTCNNFTAADLLGFTTLVRKNKFAPGGCAIVSGEHLESDDHTPHLQGFLWKGLHARVSFRGGDGWLTCLITETQAPDPRSPSTLSASRFLLLVKVSAPVLGTSSIVLTSLLILMRLVTSRKVMATMIDTSSRRLKLRAEAERGGRCSTLLLARLLAMPSLNSSGVLRLHRASAAIFTI